LKLQNMTDTADTTDKRKRWHAVIDHIDPSREIRGVEVGVWRGIMSRELLAARPLLHLEMVDPYRTGVPGTAWWDSGSVMPSREQSLYDAAYARARATTAFAAGRATFHKMPSVAAAAGFGNQSLDFVFIDGDHSYAGVVEDILAWLPKVKIGGWIGGHDWDKPQRGQVTEAVRACFPASDIEIDAEATWFLPVTTDLQAVDPRTP
jgi:hypothetical protein